MLQEPEKTQENTPDVIAVGPKMDGFNPVISLTVYKLHQKTIDDLISEKNEILDETVI